MKNVLLMSGVILVLYSSCQRVRQYPESVLGYVPVYASSENANEIKSLPVQDYKNPGKIYKYGTLAFQIDNGSGIHVIDISHPDEAKKIRFIQVLGCSEISIRNNILYTDNFSDLVAINISDIENISVTKRLNNVYPKTDQKAPPVGGTYFECVDETKGNVIGWTQKTINNPKCYKP